MNRAERALVAVALESVQLYVENGEAQNLDEAIKCLRVLRLYVEPSQTAPEGVPLR